jgi:hypothetical protein
MIADTFNNDPDPFALARQGKDDAQLFVLVAEEARLREIGCDFRERADALFFAINDRRERFQDIEEEDLPEPIGPLYAEAQRYEAAADESYDRIRAARPATIADATAVLQRAADYDDPNLARAAIAGLREIAMRDSGSGDPELRQAERDLAALLSKFGGNDDPPVDDEMKRVYSLINATAPATLAGVLVKLRFLADPDIGMEAGDRDDDYSSLRQILSFLEQGAA